MKNEVRARLMLVLIVAIGGVAGSCRIAAAAATDGSGGAIVGRQFDSADVPRGDSAFLNATTSGEQRRPNVAVLPEGDFVAVWDSTVADGSGLDVVGRVFGSDGSPLGAELQINTYTGSNQRRASVAANADGQFLVVWESSNAQDGSGTGVFAQQFAADGEPIGTEIQVNGFTTGAQEFAQVAATADGFVVVWESDLPDTNVATIHGQRFDTAGQRVGTEFTASSYSPDGQRRPAVAATPDGGFVVVWDSGGQDGGGRGIFGRRYASSGAGIGGEIQINSFTTGGQRSPSVAADSTGGFLIVWQSAAQDGSGTGIFAQRYGSNGIRIGTEFQVNTFTSGDQANPKVAPASADGFAVVWQSFGDDGESYGIDGRHYRADGSAGPVFPINENGEGEQTLPAVASAGDDPVVVWQTRATCPGDCDDSRTVTVDELVLGVNLALDRAVMFCAAIDPDGDRTVTVDELIRAVNATLAGCPA
jgi:hypothetical protein